MSPGILEWGGYQRAKLVSRMRDDLQVPSPGGRRTLGDDSPRSQSTVPCIQGAGTDATRRRVWEHARPEMYGIFHEAVSVPAARDWLPGWDEDDAFSPRRKNLHQFYALICPASGDDGEEKAPKITGYGMVRELRRILLKPDAKRVPCWIQRRASEAVSSGTAGGVCSRVGYRGGRDYQRLRGDGHCRVETSIRRGHPASQPDFCSCARADPRSSKPHPGLGARFVLCDPDLNIARILIETLDPAAHHALLGLCQGDNPGRRMESSESLPPNEPMDGPAGSLAGCNMSCRRWPRRAAPCNCTFNTSASDYLQGSCFVEPSDDVAISEAKSHRLRAMQYRQALRSLSPGDFERLCGKVLVLLG